MAKSPVPGCARLRRVARPDRVPVDGVTQHRSQIIFNTKQKAYDPLGALRDEHVKRVTTTRSIWDRRRLGDEREEVAKIMEGGHNVKTYTLLLKFYSARGNPGKTLQTFEAMKAKGLEPNDLAYAAVLNGLVVFEDSRTAEATDDYLQKQRNVSGSVRRRFRTR